MSDLALRWVSPTRLEIPDSLVHGLRPHLEVLDKSADFQWKKLKKSTWQKRLLGAEYDKKLKELEDRRIRSLLRRDGRGFWVPSGLRQELEGVFGFKVVRQFELPTARPFPWKVTPKEMFGGGLFDHQEGGAAAIMAPGPCSVELPCGTGKSLMLAVVLRNLGLQAVVLVSSKVLADQLYRLLLAMLGPGLVGEFNGEAKRLKAITVCSAMATKNLAPDTSAWRYLSQSQVLLGDECHTFAADVLESQALEIFASAPYRGFVTASKVRGDGLDRVLLGVVGPTAYSMSFLEAVARGLLAEPDYVTVSMSSGVQYLSRDPDRMTRAHLYQSESVARVAGALARGLARAGYSVLILVEEFPQAALVLREVPEAEVMHGGTGKFLVELELDGVEALEVPPTRVLSTTVGQMTAEALLERAGEGISLLPQVGDGPPLRVLSARKSGEVGQFLLPERCRDRSVAAVQSNFNDGSAKIVIATAAGRVGVDLKPPAPMGVMYLVGGTSEVSLVQGMGRGTRRQGKDHFLFFDFRIEELARHYEARRAIMERLWSAPVVVPAQQVLDIWGKS